MAGNPGNDAKPPGELSDEQLDVLLEQARWAEISPPALGRLTRKLEAAPGPVARAPARSMARWLYAGAAAAALVAFALLWTLWPAERDGIIAEVPQEPVPQEPRTGSPNTPGTEQPRFVHAVLPGREATELEIAWANVVRREQEKAADNVASQPPQPGRLLAPATARALRPARQSNRELLEIVLEDSGEDLQRARAARLIDAATLRQALAQPALADRVPELLWALTINQDPAAADVLLSVAERDPQGARQAVGQAPAGAPGVQGLIHLLQDPVVPRRESAAALLAASRDPAIYDALARRLAVPAGRRETLMALLSSQSPRARAYIVRAQANPQLRPIIHSLRIQGTDSSQERPLPVIL